MALRALVSLSFLNNADAASLRSAAGADAGWHLFDYHAHGTDWLQGQCGSRAAQSPIDFSKLMTGSLEPTGYLSYLYHSKATPFEIYNTGHTLTADFQGLNYGGLTYQNDWYNLMYINIHTFSEHTFNGYHYPLELHLVHKKFDNDGVIIVAIPVTCSSIPPSLLQTNSSRRFLTSRGTAPAAMLQTSDGNIHAAHEGDEATRSREAFCRAKAAAGVNSDGAAPAPGAAPGPAPAPDPCAHPVGYQGYEPPMLQPNMNGVLQKFLMVEPPPPNTKTVVPLIANDPFDLNAFMDGAEFYEYFGSMTAPPCAEIVTWFVRSEPIVAADSQIQYLADSIFRTNAMWGNFRSIMPLAGRTVKKKKAMSESPPPPDHFDHPMPMVAKTDREYRAMKWGKDALKVAKSSLDYIKDLDTRLKNAADVRKEVYTQPLGVTTPPPTTTPGVPLDVLNTAAQMAKGIQEAAEDAVREAMDGIKQQANAAAYEAAFKAAATVSKGDFIGAGIPVSTPPPPYGGR